MHGLARQQRGLPAAHVPASPEVRQWAGAGATSMGEEAESALHGWDWINRTVGAQISCSISLKQGQDLKNQGTPTRENQKQLPNKC